MSSSDWLKFQSDPSSAGFLPSAYIHQALTNVQHANLEKKLVDGVYQSKHETEQQLKSLIRENLGTFIDSRDAMRSILEADGQLFSGEALAAIVSIFEKGRDQCEKLVAPMMETHEELHLTRELRELLKKFQPVTAVPQVMYRACGVRVWSSVPPLQQRTLSDMESKDGFGAATSSSLQKEEREGGGSVPRGRHGSGGDSSSLSAGGARCSSVRGSRATGASFCEGVPLPRDRTVPQSSLSSSFPAEKGFIFWYGMILFRQNGHLRKRNDAKDASTCKEERSGRADASASSRRYSPSEWESDDVENEPVPLDIAVGQFRRALLFLEEHYFMGKNDPQEPLLESHPYPSTTTTAAVNSVERPRAEGSMQWSARCRTGESATSPRSPAEESKASRSMPSVRHEREGSTQSEPNATGGSATFTDRAHHPHRVTQQMQREHTHRMFMYTYAASLLRAALFMLDYLAGDHLRYIHPAQTVAIEEIFGMMMELATGTVKLHGFARAVGEQLQEGAGTLTGGLHALSTGENGTSWMKDHVSESSSWPIKAGRGEVPRTSDASMASGRRLSAGAAGGSRPGRMEHSDTSLVGTGARGLSSSGFDPYVWWRSSSARPISFLAGHWHPVQYYMEILQWQFQELVCETVVKPLSLRARFLLEQPQCLLQPILRAERLEWHEASRLTSGDEKWNFSIQNDILKNWNQRSLQRASPFSSPSPEEKNGGGDGSDNRKSLLETVKTENGSFSVQGGREPKDVPASSAAAHGVEANDTTREEMEPQEKALDTLTEQFFALTKTKSVQSRGEGRELSGEKDGQRGDFAREPLTETSENDRMDEGGATRMMLTSLSNAFASRLFPHPIHSANDIPFLGSHLFSSSSSSHVFESLLSVRLLAPSPRVEPTDDNSHFHRFSFPISLPGLDASIFRKNQKNHFTHIPQEEKGAVVDATPILLHSCEQIMKCICQSVERTTEKTVQGMDSDPKSATMGWRGESAEGSSSSISPYSITSSVPSDFVVDAYVLLSEVAHLLEDTIAHYWAGVGQTIQTKAFDYAPSSDSSMCQWLHDEVREEKVRQKRVRRRGRQQERLLRRGAREEMRDGYDSHRWSDDVEEEKARREGEEDEESEEDEEPSVDEEANPSSLARKLHLDMLPELRFLPVTTETHVNLQKMKVAKALLEDRDLLTVDEEEEFELCEQDRDDTNKEEEKKNGEGERRTLRSIRQRLERQKVKWESKISLQKYVIIRLQELIRSAGLMMRSIFTAFMNQCMVHVFMPLMQQFSPSDLALNNKDERVEMVAALVVEVLLQQWEKMISVLCDTFLSIKIAIIESFSAAMVAALHTAGTTAATSSFSSVGNATPPSTAAAIRQAMLNDASAIITELERVRSACLKDYIRGVGMLMNAYISLFPFILYTSETALERRVRPRLCREHPSSTTSNKFLNTLSMLLDRTVPFLHREEEVYNHQAFFSSTENACEGRRGSGSTRGSRRRHTSTAPGSGGRHRDPLSARLSEERDGTRRSSAGGMENANDEGAYASETTDLIAKLGAFQQLLVVEHTQQHGAYIAQLCSDLLLVFVDMMHMKCQLVCAASEETKQFSVTARQREIVACMADMLCLPYTIIPLFMEHLLSPSLLAWLVMLDPSIRAEDRPNALLEAIGGYREQHLSRVEEHAQLALSAIVQMHLVVPQQQITQAVYQDGFAKPEMDWQRISRLTAGEVRPYLSDVLVIIAEANEALHWIEQPALASAVTQKLFVHLATTMMMGLTVNANYVELLTADCSMHFYDYGALLLEAEFSTVCKLLEKVQQATPPPHILPELPSALHLLHRWSEELIRHYKHIMQSRRHVGDLQAPRQGVEGTSGSGPEGEQKCPLDTHEPPSDAMWTTRDARREELAQAALRHLAYMLEVILNSQWQSQGKTEADEDGEEEEEEEEESYVGMPTWLERLMSDVEGKECATGASLEKQKERRQRSRKTGKGIGEESTVKKKKKVKKSEDAVRGDESAIVEEKTGVAPPSLIAESVMKQLAERIEVQYEKETVPPRELHPHGTSLRKSSLSLSSSVKLSGVDKMAEPQETGSSMKSGTVRPTSTRTRQHVSSRLLSSTVAQPAELANRSSMRTGLKRDARKEEEKGSEEEEDVPEPQFANVWQRAKHHLPSAGSGGVGEKSDRTGGSPGVQDGKLSFSTHDAGIGTAAHRAPLHEPIPYTERRSRWRGRQGDAECRKMSGDGEKPLPSSSVGPSSRVGGTISIDSNDDRGSPTLSQRTATDEGTPSEHRRLTHYRQFKRTTCI